MIPLDDKSRRSVAAINRDNEEFVNYLKECYQQELYRLPYANEATAILQGRCQVLRELVSIFEPEFFQRHAKREQRDIF
jgi:hypothetical protein